MPEPTPRIDPADPYLAQLSPDLREIALTLDPAVWDEVSMMDPKVRERVLAGAGELQRHEREAQERQQREDAEWAEAGRAQVDHGVNDFAQRDQQALWAHLEKTFPISADKAVNQQAHGMLLQLTLNELRADPRIEETRRKADEAFRYAAAMKYVGDKSAEVKARIEGVRHAREFNDKWRALIDQTIPGFKAFLESFRAPATTQAQDHQPEQYIN